MKNIRLFRRSKSLRALLILLFVSAPLEWSVAQLTLSTPKATLGQVIQTVKSQSKYQFFYDDKLSDMTVESISVKDASLDEFLDKLLKGKGVTYKIEDNIVYLSVKQTPVKALNKKEHEITGTVIDANKEPLIGVNVSVQGTSNGTITNYDGKYVLKVDNPNAKIVFSYIGYKQQTVTLGKNEILNVTLVEDTQIISEVVVTALGIKREKKMLGYAIQELKSDELNKTSNPSITGALQGKIAGLQMNTSSTGLNGSTKITIRGNSSLTDNNQPLWVVDGVPFNDESNSSASLGRGIDRGSAIEDINPEDIESVSVLKGANAAALYGSRAGNGVILVTTKKGLANNGLGVTYTGSATWTDVVETLEMQDLFGQGSGGIYDRTSVNSFGPKLDGLDREAWNGKMYAYSKYGNKLKDYFNTGFSQNHNLSIGGVSGKANYRASFGNSESSGLFHGEHLSKINLDLKSSIELNKYITMDAKLSLSKTRARNRPMYGEVGEVYQLLFIPNNVRLNDLESFSSSDRPHVNWHGPTTTILNPYYVNHQHSNLDERWRAFGYYGINLQVTSWLRVTGKYAFDYYRTKLEVQNKTDALTTAPITGDNFDKGEENFFESNAELMVMGDHKIGDKFRIGYTLGANVMHQSLEGLTGSAYNMLDKNSPVLNSALGFNSAMQKFKEKEIQSVMGTAQIAYDEYVALDLTARNDWSSTLPIDNCSYFYPSASVSYIISDFMNKMDWRLPKWLTFAKLRFSLAQVGKDTDPYILRNVTEYHREPSGPLPNTITTKANDNLKPEISTSYELGLDMKFLNNRLGFDFTYYYSITKNQIMKVPTTGSFVAKWINAGEISNKGVELMIYSTPIRTKNFEFNLDMNLAHNKSIVKSLSSGVSRMSFNFADEKFLVDVGAEEGGLLGDIYPKKSYARDNKGNIIVSSDGTPKLQDTTNPDAIGNIQPKLLMSVTPSFTYKGFTVSALFDMKFGGNIVSVSEAMSTYYGTAKRTEKRENLVFTGVDENGKTNDKVIPAELYYTTVGGQQGIAEEFIYDASFIKLKELSFGYFFPKKWLSKTPLTSLKLAFVGRNLCYLLKHTPGTSPEGGFNTSMFSQAIDYTSVPYSRTLGFSVNVSF